jgi:nucleotide-binding universal stress UspA family protein
LFGPESGIRRWKGVEVLMRDIRRVLTGIDYSEYSREAARYAVSLAIKLSASVDFLHVVEYQAYVGSGFGAGFTAPLKQYISKQQEQQQQGLDEMKRFVGEFENRGAEINYHVAIGNAPAEIIRVAKEIDADLIVLGTHGRKGISQMIIGSVTEKVIRRAHCPVLTVKLTNQDFMVPG